ncbi:hypothetical protein CHINAEXTREME_08770 [Halobiforma lacisalsi AJ5]|uniref:DUF8009 domain-containing protein n=1 Tax=Natronobacterium lacisalsi AJ5 TaxID=358396 RepID=M0LB09_NATLA|nr:hypothetical protein [Halobiforma lacisalsi]APW97867.1 hypothetical protein CHINAEXTREME_08770 [Halobiforma lacisalsi AJ5]EMA29135.1 hypothetical protein C445_17344 [Halobiforma lacisalsi AJ5]
MADDDPSVIQSIAISPDDAVDAYVYTRENPGEAVLRITPPFHGRMRARIHVYRVDDAHVTGAVHVSAAEVIEDDVLEEYPELEGELEAVDDAEAERIRKRHAEAVEEWQERAADAIVDAVALEVDGERREVEVKPLG